MNNQELLLIQKLAGVLDGLTTRLGQYDAAVRFCEANYPAEAQIFKGCLEIVETTGAPIPPSVEHAELVQALHSLVADELRATGS